MPSCSNSPSFFYSPSMSCLSMTFALTFEPTIQTTNTNYCCCNASVANAFIFIQSLCEKQKKNVSIVIKCNTMRFARIKQQQQQQQHQQQYASVVDNKKSRANKKISSLEDENTFMLLSHITLDNVQCLGMISNSSTTTTIIERNIKEILRNLRRNSTHLGL